MAPLFARQMGNRSPRPSFLTRTLPASRLSCPGQGPAMWQNPPTGRGPATKQILDPHGRHAACRAKSLHTRRHGRIRDLLAKLAWQAGLRASTEQAVLIPDQILPDGQPAPGSVRPTYTQLTSTSWSRRGRNYGLTSRSTQRPQTSPLPRIRSHLGTPALKTGNFSKKIGRFSKTQKRIY